MSEQINPQLIIGEKYINKTQLPIKNIDYSEVIKINSGTVENCINILSSNGYSVIKNESAFKNVSNLNYTIAPSGMNGEYSGTDNEENYVFKLLKNTPINSNNNSEILPINAKITLFKDKTNSNSLE